MSEYNSAYKQIPERIYEKFLFIFGAPYLPLLLMFLMTPEQNKQFLMPSSTHLELTLLSAFAMIIGRITDVNSTVKAVNINDYARSSGVETGLEEISPIAGSNPTLKRFKKIAPFEGIFTGIASVHFPIIGAMIGLQSGLNALNNSRKARRIKKAIQLKNN